MLPYTPIPEAQVREFDENGEDPTIDTKRLIDMMTKAEFDGYICIEIPRVLEAKALLEKYI